jgi:hypothetical protein
MTGGKQVAGVIQQFLRDQVAICLEGYMLHLCRFTLRAAQLLVGKCDAGQITAERQMPERYGVAFALTVGVHAPTTLLADAVIFSQNDGTLKTEYSPSFDCFMDRGICVLEPVKGARYPEITRSICKS